MSALRIADMRGMTAARYVLRLRWTNDKVFVVDLEESVHRLKALKNLRDRKFFARAEIGEGGHSIVWPDGADMGADRLWEIALEQNGRPATAEFIRWRMRNGLSLTDAAAAVGISRRAVAYYASGEEPVPRTVQLACIGWE